MQFLLEYSQTEFYVSLFLLMILASLISSWVWDVTEYFLKKSEKKDEFEFNYSITRGKTRQTLTSQIEEEVSSQMSEYQGRLDIYVSNLSDALERIHKLEHEGSREVVLKIDAGAVRNVLSEVKPQQSTDEAAAVTSDILDSLKRQRAKENAANFKKLKKQMKDF